MKRSFWAKSTLHLGLGGVLLCSILYSYTWQQLTYKPLPTDDYTFVVQPGANIRQLTQDLHNAGVLPQPNLLRWFAVLSGSASKIKAGEYRISPGTTAVELIRNVVEGKVVQYSFTVVEGWRSIDLINALQNNPKIKATLTGLSDKQIIAKLDVPILHLEGMFLPDTYNFTAGTSDVEFLRRAYYKMQEKLQAVWDSRPKDSVLRTPYEALVLASIIEKESSINTEHHEISGVFQRRLQKNMRLQADPTVIYALGDKYKGVILKNHLKVNSPYNTYVKFGLPPTPIALPGVRALQAAVQPAVGESLYFVADGNGGHVFSKDLEAHNRAVKRFRVVELSRNKKN